MRHFRALYRIILIAVGTVMAFIVYLTVLLLIRVVRIPCQPWRNFCLRSWTAFVSMILGLNVEVRGEPPRPPFFLVSNHQSFIDILLFLLKLRCTFIVRKDVAAWPVIGFIVKSAGMIFVDRKKPKDVMRVNRLIASSVESGLGVILFPEGTTSAGEKILPFKASLLEYPARIGLPVHYAAISYRTTGTDTPADQSICWRGEISFPAHIYKLAGNRTVYCRLRFGRETVGHSDRKYLARLLHEKISFNYLLPEKKSLSNRLQSDSSTP